MELGVARLNLSMFLRKLGNRSGSVSIQIIQKVKGKSKVVRTIGCAESEQEIQKLWHIGKQEISRISNQPKLFTSEADTLVEQAFGMLSNSNICTIGPELIFGRIFDYIGFGSIDKEMFRHLVIARLAYPLSKLKTVDYLFRFQGILLDVDAIYRFLDKLNDGLKDQVEQIAFQHTLRMMGGHISIVFYDMTTLYFEASDEDDLRKTGFSKDGKHSNPQIYIGCVQPVSATAPLYCKNTSFGVR